MRKKYRVQIENQTLQINELIKRLEEDRCTIRTLKEHIADIENYQLLTKEELNDMRVGTIIMVSNDRITWESASYEKSYGDTPIWSFGRDDRLCLALVKADGEYYSYARKLTEKEKG